ncbi:MAG: PQQ-like beta-propeller repeat protein [Bacteroidetes bacterium]|nr:PQQ-like beta-propeller repeat protein [Bacteroidota bacterium]
MTDAKEIRQALLQALIAFLVLVFCAQIATAQWEEIDDLYSNRSIAYDRRDSVLICMSVNGDIYTATTNNLSWSFVTRVPDDIYIPADMELTSSGDIFIVSDSCIYRYDHRTGEWTGSLPLEDKPYLDYMVVDSYNDSIVVTSSFDGYFRFVSADYGRTWRSIGAEDPAMAIRNFINFSSSGLLYAISNWGLKVSSDIGRTWDLVGDTIRLTVSWFTTPMVIHDDARILVLTDLGGLYLFDQTNDLWSRIREDGLVASYHTIGLLDDGGIAMFYFTNSGDQYVEISTDDGLNWERRKMPNWGFTTSQKSFDFIDIICGNSDELIVCTLSEQVYRYNVPENTYTRAVRPLTNADAFEILPTEEALIVSSAVFYQWYSRETSELHGSYSHPFGFGMNSVVTPKGTWYRLSPEYGDMATIWYSSSFFGPFIVPLPAECYDFILTAERDRLVLATDYGIELRDTLGTLKRNLTMSPAVLIAGNAYDEFVAADRDCRVFVINRKAVMLGEADLSSSMDSVVAVSINYRGAVIALGRQGGYRSPDHGKTWVPLTLPDDSLRLRHVIADHAGWFYMHDDSAGVYRSSDDGETFEAIPIAPGNPFCSVTNLALDREYLYACTQGCGVFRWPLPHPSDTRTPPPPAATTQRLKNLSVRSGNPVRITMPGIASPSAEVQVSDLTGRNLVTLPWRISPAGNEMIIDTRSVTPGVYNLVVRSKGRVQRCLLHITAN